MIFNFSTFFIVVKNIYVKHSYILLSNNIYFLRVYGLSCSFPLQIHTTHSRVFHSKLSNKQCSLFKWFTVYFCIETAFLYRAFICVLKNWSFYVINIVWFNSNIQRHSSKLKGEEIIEKTQSIWGCYQGGPDSRASLRPVVVAKSKELFGLFVWNLLKQFYGFS